MSADAFPTEFASVEPTLQTIREGFPAIRTITTTEQFSQAGEMLKAVKGALKQIETQRVEITGPINESLRKINAQAKAAAEPFVKAENAIKGAMVAYQDEQERLRREEQRRVEEAARKERERLAALQREEERTAREKAVALRREAEAAAAAGRAAEAAKLAARAVSTEERSAAKVEDLHLREAMVVAPVIDREPPKVAGVATREVWKFEITDPARVPDQYKVVDEARVRKVVQALKADANIPGVRVYSERQLAAGAA